MNRLQLQTLNISINQRIEINKETFGNIRGDLQDVLNDTKLSDGTVLSYYQCENIISDQAIRDFFRNYKTVFDTLTFIKSVELKSALFDEIIKRK